MTVTNMALSATPAKILPSSAAHAQAIASAQKRIDSALQSGATGPKGFLIWVKAAFPGAISKKILAAAAAHQAAVKAAASSGPIAGANSAAKAGMGVGRYMGPTTFGAVPIPLHPSGYDYQRGRRAGLVSYNRRQQRLLGSLGDATTDSLGSDALAPITIDPTIANASTSSASPSWLSSIGSAVTAATQAYLGIQQSKDAQTLFDTNLQRAQQGLAPLNANPAAYGIVSPQVNVGLSSSASTLLMWGGIGLGAILLLNVGVKAAKRS